MPTSFEIATNSARGTMKIADREFIDRRLTLDEEAQQAAGTYCEQNDTDFLAVFLSSVQHKPKEKPVTAAWVTANLTEEERVMTVLYILGGNDRITLHLAEKAKRLELQLKAQDALMEANYAAPLPDVGE